MDAKSSMPPRDHANADSSNIPDGTLTALIDAAKIASSRAYCPYSDFRVGAAVLTESNEIFAGCNVENASYGLTICAERNAVFHAVACGMKKVRAVAIFTPTESPTAPCGACRQVLNEFGPNAIISSTGISGKTQRWTLSELLPDAFGPGNLK